MKIPKKLLCIALTLVMTIALAAPAFAAATSVSNNDLEPKGYWGDNAGGVTLNGIVSKENEMQWVGGDKFPMYNVAVGGSLVMDFNFPAGKNRMYIIEFYGKPYRNPEEEAPEWDVQDAPPYYVEESTGMSQFVYTFSDYDMGQIEGFNKYIIAYVAWQDIAADGNTVTDEGYVSFAIRVVPAEEETTGFSDVKESDYFAVPVAWAVEKKIAYGTGDGKYSPKDTCNQGQILSFLWRAKGEPKPAGTVTGTQYYDVPAQWADEQGLTGGKFSADAPCTRAMVVTYMWKLAGSPNVGSADFSDVPANTEISYAVAWAVEQKIAYGTGDGKFSPDETCNRGDIVTFLHRAYA